MDRREIEAEEQRRRRRQQQPPQERRRRDSSATTRERHSIHLESAPWLGQRKQQQPPSQQQVPQSTAAHVRRDASRPRQQHQPSPAHHRNKHLESQATKGSSSQYTQATTSHSTACSTDSLMSDSTRNLLYGKAVKMSHAMVRRAHQMIKNVERSRVLAEGSRRQRSMEIDGYRFVSLSQGVAVYEDATYIRLEHKATRPRLVGVSAVKATLDEFIDAFGRDSELAFSHLNPDMTSCRQMHAISEEQDRRIGVKWMAMQPTWTGSLARRRDFVVLECEENFSLAQATGNVSNSSGSAKERRGWVQMMHSVQLPWCPPMEKASSIVRGSMYQTGVVVLESEASPEWLHVLSVVEIDMKGNIADRAQRANALRRIESLEAVAPTLVQQRLQRMSLLRTKQFNAAKPAKDSHCSVCTQRFGLTSLRLHHYCRKCSASVCGRCSRNWQIDPAVKKKTRVCGLCIMATCPSKGNGSAFDDDEVAQGILSMQRAIRVHMSQHEPQADGGEEEQRDCRAQTLPEGIPAVAGSQRTNFRADPNLQSAPQGLNRANSMPFPAAPPTPPPSSSQPRISRYFDLPMDARELSHFSEDDESAVSDSGDTIYPFSDRGGRQFSSSRGLDESAGSGYSVFQSHRGCASRLSRSSRSTTVAEEEEEEENEEGVFDLDRSVGRRTRTKSAYKAYVRPEDEIHL
ncbi:hypothetical protein Gpo141_00005557 [Globisporangium polare]